MDETREEARHEEHRQDAINQERLDFEDWLRECDDRERWMDNLDWERSQGA